MSGQEVTTNIAPNSTSNPVLGASTTIGVAGSLVMGVLSWVMLLVSRDLPTALVIGSSLLAFAILAFLFLRNIDSNAPKAGMLAGLIGGLISIVFLGSLMTRQVQTLAEFKLQSAQPEGESDALPGGFTPSGIALGLGVIIGMMAIGWIIGKAAGPKSGAIARHPDWRSRLAWVTALSYLPLIAIGGLVTSTESGLAVPDSVTTYGSISILFPLSLMDETRIYLEHSHRIFGTFAGLATVILVVRMFGAPSRLLPRLMSCVLLLGVIAQGVMGALRVSEQSQALASLHGVLAQLVFALAIATGVACTKRWELVSPSNDGIDASRSTRLMLIIAFVALCIQLVFGSMTRHLDSGHALMSHIGFSFVVVVLAIIAGAKCIKLGKSDEGSKPIRPYGAIIHALVILQFTLGWGALAMTQSGEEHPALPTSTELATAHGIRVGEAIIATSHHMIGALLLASVTGALVWGLRIASRPKNG